jgi:hypothetical protein
MNKDKIDDEEINFLFRHFTISSGDCTECSRSGVEVLPINAWEGVVCRQCFDDLSLVEFVMQDHLNE